MIKRTDRGCTKLLFREDPISRNNILWGISVTGNGKTIVISAEDGIQKDISWTNALFYAQNISVHLPSLEEFRIIVDNLDEINRRLKSTSLSEIPSGTYWTRESKTQNTAVQITFEEGGTRTMTCGQYKWKEFSAIYLYND